MSTVIIEGFEVLSADGDGRGETHMAYFADENSAKQLVAQSPGWIRMRPYSKTIVVYETFGEYVNAQVEALRAKALAKLTKEEREALGV